ncbi:TetR/AcrR family transcriptional regulator [Arenibaculum pallidiluteum]|uniref:TetR/AcrR family transcriptional regulator n=1 Tax=Arenibaculum pallidiluteum TaxID=2812559 RepID=UPI001A96B8F0|nr:TetR/AcrR family transcriptional regulator [Arenibaculum pallidiluteum]
MVQKSCTEAGGRPRGRPRSFDPDTALDRAVEVFWRLGFEAADTDALASAMGLTKPSVYAAFGNKEQLYLKALQRYGQRGRAEITALLEAAPSMRAGINAVFNHMAERVSGQHGGSGCLLTCVAAQSAHSMLPVREILEAGIAARDKAFTEFLRSGIARGELPAGFPVERRASLMNDLLSGLALRARAGASLEELREIGASATEAILAGA